MGDQTLNPDAPNRVAYGADTEFTVNFTNQGENDEQDVTVSVAGTKQGGGTKIDETRKVPQSTKGTKTEVQIPVTKPVTGSYSITVEVRPVRGEKNTENNKQRFEVIFQ